MELSFSLSGQMFTESCLILPRMNRPILGLPFFERNNITIHPKTRTLSLPDMTLQLNEISSPTGNIKKTYSKKKFYLKTTEKLVIRPNCQEVSSCQLTSDGLPIGTNAIVEMLPNFERKTGLCLTDSIGCLDSERKTPVGFLNVQSTVITVHKRILIAKVSLLSPQQAQFCNRLV